MESMDVGEEMIEEPDHELFKVLGRTIEENDWLKEILCITKEIIKKHDWTENTYETLLT